jgi:hypothetical protein
MPAAELLQRCSLFLLMLVLLFAVAYYRPQSTNGALPLWAAEDRQSAMPRRVKLRLAKNKSTKNSSNTTLGNTTIGNTTLGNTALDGTATPLDAPRIHPGVTLPWCDMRRRDYAAGLLLTKQVQSPQ